MFSLPKKKQGKVLMERLENGYCHWKNRLKD